MTAPVFLNVAQARAQFKRVGFVYTLRRRRGTGITVARQGYYFKFRNLGPVRVTLVRAGPPRGLLSRHLKDSGFSSVREWRKAAAPDANALYLVERVGT